MPRCKNLIVLAIEQVPEHRCKDFEIIADLLTTDQVLERLARNKNPVNRVYGELDSPGI